MDSFGDDGAGVVIDNDQHASAAPHRCHIVYFAAATGSAIGDRWRQLQESPAQTRQQAWQKSVVTVVSMRTLPTARCCVSHHCVTEDQRG